MEKYHKNYYRLDDLKERIAFCEDLKKRIAELPVSESEFCREGGLGRAYLNLIKNGHVLAGREYVDRVNKALAFYENA